MQKGDRRREPTHRAWRPPAVEKGCGASWRRTLGSDLALITERNGEQNKAENEERDDAVEAFEKRAVIDEDFDDDQAERHERLPAQQYGFSFDSKSDQSGSVGGPKKRKREVLGEAGVNTQASARAEVIPQFKREGDQREYVDGNGEDAEGVEFLAADGRGLLARGVDDYAEAEDQNGVSGESLIEH